MSGTVRRRGLVHVMVTEHLRRRQNQNVTLEFAAFRAVTRSYESLSWAERAIMWELYRRDRATPRHMRSPFEEAP